MKVVAFCLLAVLGTATPEADAFQKFVTAYNKQYATEEIFTKYAVFKANLERIQAHNLKNLSWNMAVNEYADLTGEEFRAIHMGKVMGSPAPLSDGIVSESLTTEADPSLDWRDKGAVSPVRDQGQCGACWAFTVVGAIESACYIATHNLTQLSVQMVIDCTTTIGNMGCNGGFMDRTFAWAAKNPLCAETAYPYSGQSGTCKHTCPPIKWCKVTGFTTIKQGDEAAVMTALNKQPVAVAVDASDWQFYSEGVYSGKCSKSQLDHTALLIGYGTDSGKQYWTIQNTWSASWGEKGYIRLVRNVDECGIAEMALYPNVKVGP